MRSQNKKFDVFYCYCSLMILLKKTSQNVKERGKFQLTPFWTWSNHLTTKKHLIERFVIEGTHLSPIVREGYERLDSCERPNNYKNFIFNKKNWRHFEWCLWVIKYQQRCMKLPEDILFLRHVLNFHERHALYFLNWYTYLAKNILYNTVYFMQYFFFTSKFYKKTIKKLSVVRASRVPAHTFLNDLLSDHRVFLLTSNHNRVKLPLKFWHVPNFWRRLSFQKQTPLAFFNYRHVAQSEKIPAAISLNNPNFLLFTVILSNPYFWGIIRNVLHNKYQV